MATTTEDQSQMNAWQHLLSHKDRLRKENVPSLEGQSTLEIDESKTEVVMDLIMAYFSQQSERKFSEDRELEIMKQAFTSVLEVTEENIITESEASALLGFLTSKFIERRFDYNLRNVFNVKKHGKYRIRGIAGKVK